MKNLKKRIKNSFKRQIKEQKNKNKIFNIKEQATIDREEPANLTVAPPNPDPTGPTGPTGPTPPGEAAAIRNPDEKNQTFNSQLRGSGVTLRILNVITSQVNEDLIVNYAKDDCPTNQLVSWAPAKLKPPPDWVD